MKRVSVLAPVMLGGLLMFGQAASAADNMDPQLRAQAQKAVDAG